VTFWAVRNCVSVSVRKLCVIWKQSIDISVVWLVSVTIWLKWHSMMQAIRYMCGRGGWGAEAVRMEVLPAASPAGNYYWQWRCRPICSDEERRLFRWGNRASGGPVLVREKSGVKRREEPAQRAKYEVAMKWREEKAWRRNIEKLKNIDPAEVMENLKCNDVKNDWDDMKWNSCEMKAVTYVRN